MAMVQNKRKRDSQDMAGMRAAPGMIQTSNEFEQHYLQSGGDELDGTDEVMNFAEALAQESAEQAARDAQHNGDQMQGQVGDGGVNSASDTAAAAMAQYHTMTVPQSTEQSFLAQQGEGGDRQGSGADQGSSSAQQRTSSFGDFDVSGVQGSPNGNASPTGAPSSNPNAPKPSVGSDEWHKIRKDNHKEVERRRRETINEGINELAKIVPGCEKNKGSILARAVQFITQLKENETQNIEKWTLEKLLTEQAIAELSTSCDKLKAECQRAWGECEQWKKAAQKAGMGIDDDDGKGDADAEDAD
ncbi:basic helix-loop-helix protein [Vermiconidia calcicola]|uniref:Basic helix-loop-helix protein n=1 Tax=Vermiconidia calcicola TaxID=1690605 RepID=A0ACC3N190_9PEZI|nr:basic helix-loop-helix protein [Vermiconidia calcicola]